MDMHTVVLQQPPGPQEAQLSTQAEVIHKVINRANDKKRKETKTIERRIIAVYYSTKRLSIAIVSTLIILFTGVTGTPHER